MPAAPESSKIWHNLHLSDALVEPGPRCAAQVRELLHKRIRDAYLHPQFQTDVMKPLSIEPLMDQQVLAASFCLLSSLLPCSCSSRVHHSSVVKLQLHALHARLAQLFSSGCLLPDSLSLHSLVVHRATYRHAR